MLGFSVLVAFVFRGGPPAIWETGVRDPLDRVMVHQFSVSIGRGSGTEEVPFDCCDLL